mmetsp:Transcript_77804/g.137210  ORF Transcript_77804/g.137210 Transcript_77804/m.137210 type:complete len:100 (+) Transcript_77804:89-388(+)
MSGINYVQRKHPSSSSISAFKPSWPLNCLKCRQPGRWVHQAVHPRKPKLLAPLYLFTLQDNHSQNYWVRTAFTLHVIASSHDASAEKQIEMVRWYLQIC